ncbi:MAG: hypothetical protein GXZ05_04860 [Gammaproteobacteria bacterium]|nr:hypothetical protein [Gammaproteobacteria bacterium]
MQFTQFMDKYPVLSLELLKSQTRFTSVDEILAVLEARVEASPVACKIALFDHYAHTSALPEGEIADDILAAKHLVFCFGIKLPTPLAMAVRPRSIGVTELNDRFVVSFMEAPNPQMNDTLKQWVTALND